MLYKLVGNNLINPPKTLRANGEVIVNFNKSEKLQTLYGYKPLVDGEIPEYNPETEEVYITGYIETVVYETKLIEEVEEKEPIEPEGGEVVIMPVYGVRPIPEPEPMPELMPTLEEKVAALEEEMVNTQVAVAEVYELIEGGI